MNITKEAVKRLQELRQHGDLTAIAKESGLSVITILNAFSSDFEQCSVKTYEAITDFYAKRSRTTARKEKYL